MKKIGKVKKCGLLASLAMLVMSFAMTLPVSAVMCLDGKTKKNKISECPEYANAEYANKELGSTFTNVVNVIIGIVGFLAVIMIIIGGISYTTSAGDAQKVKKAKDTIMYGIIGLIVAILAFAIVNFVLENLN